jgi:cell division protease FtsH
MNKDNFFKQLLIWGAIFIGLFLLVTSYQNVFNKQVFIPLTYSDVINRANQGSVSEIDIKGNFVIGKLSEGGTFMAQIGNPQIFADRMQEKNIRVRFVPIEDDMPSLLHLLLSWFPMLLLIGVWVFFMRQMNGTGGKAMGFGRSKAKLMEEGKNTVTFNDVAGIDEAKEDLEEIVEYLRSPKKFQKLGGKIPRGVLLVGPPGTGKTLLAKAIAGEANVPFFSISGSDFVEMFVGVGASRVRDMFEQGRKSSPCIIFIDEIDAVGRHRGAGLGGGNDEREQTLNQMLVEMDGFDGDQGVIIIAATNRPDVLDPALLRPGRFDRQITVPYPDLIGREKVLQVHSKKTPLHKNVDLKVIARGTPGFSGADLANLVNEAALLAARQNRTSISMEHFEHAKDKILMGAERRSLVMTDEEKSLTAYHEGGHALVAYHLVDSDPIHKATIIPRGRALGMVMRLPERDRIFLSKAKLIADIAVAMGGRIAEEMIFGKDKVTTGASSDIKMATDMARRMVTECGMSDVLGPLSYGASSQEVFLGHSVTQSKNLSETTSQTIDAEIKKIVDDCYTIAFNILKKHKKQLEIIARSLLEYETLSGEDIKTLLNGKKLNRPEEVAPVIESEGFSTLDLSKRKKKPSLEPNPEPGV